MTIASTGTTFNAQVGFNSSAPVTKQTVTGSRSDGSALLSALTGLVAYGLITDNSTA
jgi:hypothetical protein